MRGAMCKPCDMPFKQFEARLTKFKKIIPRFPGSEATKKIPAKELNEILLHTVTKK